MAQKNSVDRLPQALRERVICLLKDPAIMQTEIVTLINAEMGKNVLSPSALNRFTRKLRQQQQKEVMSPEMSLARIADSLEALVDILKTWNKPVCTQVQNSGLMEAEKHEILRLFLAGYSLNRIGEDFKGVLSEFFGSWENALTIRDSIERINLNELAASYDRYQQEVSPNA
jgi:hypothetical protein